MIRKAFILHVNPDQHAEYEKRHNPIWPELEATLKKHGASNYTIFLDSFSNQLFCVVDIESEKKWNAVAKTAICKKWWKYMAPVMPSNPDNSPVARELREVFHMN